MHLKSTVTLQNDNNGHSVAVTTSTATNYTLPDALTPNATTSLQTQATYSLSFAPASVAPPGQTLNNGASGTAAYTSYDNYGRVAYTLAPAQTSGGTGAQTNYTYGYNSTTGWTITATTTNSSGSTTHYTTTTLDGLGRAASVQAGTGTTPLSEVDTAYAPCACSPLGKMHQQSQPYNPLTSAPLWTTYTYDALGRTVSVLLADGASSTTYLYQGNVTTVADPAGKWKQYFNDAFGNLLTVIEPDPAVNPAVPASPISTNPLPAGYLLTSYTYDQFNHLTQVAMPRSTANGPYTQTRTFTYTPTSHTNVNLPAVWLTSATNPENGTVSYTYNSDGTLKSTLDAKGNTLNYAYDSYGRLVSSPTGTFSWDTCPANDTVCTPAAGQLVEAQFYSGVAALGPNQLSFQYDYTYTPAGSVASKALTVQSGAHLGFGGKPAYGTLIASYTYDNQGALTTIAYPGCQSWQVCTPQTFTYGLDALERPTSLTDNLNTTYATGVTYNAAGQTSLGGRLYNSLSQLTQAGGFTYNYSTNQNNGQITSSFDTLNNETVTYTYDALKRLSSASSSNMNWTGSYTYDGWGNLTQMQPSGLSAQADPTTNRLQITGAHYDQNGNFLYATGFPNLQYDVSNRVVEAQTNNNYYYGYDSDNRRIYYRDAGNNETIYFYGAGGAKLAQFTISGFPVESGYPVVQFTAAGQNVYFTGIPLRTESHSVTTDRLGSIASNSAGNHRYYPYGMEYSQYSNSPNDTEKYATYTRDSLTKLDYAMNRYYSSIWGRFLSAPHRKP